MFFALFAVVGIAISGALGISLLTTFKTHLWAETPCTIVESRRTDQGIERDSTKDFVIRYRYRAAGREHTSDQFTAGIKESLSNAKIERLLLTYPAGGQARCYVNPKNPAEAVLQRGSLWFGLFLLIPLIFLAVGVGGVLSIWRPARTSPSVARRRARAEAMGRYGPIFFFGLFALVGGGLTYAIAIRPLLTWFDARDWPETPCDIISSNVGTHRSSGKDSSTTYSVDIVYRYRVGGREYRSERYSVMSGSSSGRSGKQAIVSRYPAGSRARCFVNPKDPTEALLNRDLTAFMFIGLIPLLFLVVGVSGLVSMLRKLIRESGTLAPAGSIAPPTLPVASTAIPGAPPTLLGTPGSGPTVLAPSASPGVKLLGALFIAIFWNGITGVFVGLAVKSWTQKRPEIFLTVLIIPFVLIGLGLIGFAVAMFLNLFNPRVALAVSSQSVPLGGKLDLRWSFSGATSRIRRLRIVLEGREECRYRRGTSTSTDKQVFAQLPIIETDNPAQIREGHTQLTIPASLMHTWDGGNNKIIWELQVRGEIPRYPDVDDNFAFTVLPQPR